MGLPNWQTRIARSWPWVAMALILIFCAAIRWRLRDFPLERDEGEYAYSGQLILQGIPPYRYAYSVKFPGVHAAYALIMAVFGQSPAGIHTGTIVVNTACGLLLFLLGRRLVNAPFGVVAAATYSVMSLGQNILGLPGHATHFVNLFVLAGFLVLLRAIAGRQNWTCLPAGLLFGMALLMKQQALPIALFAGLFLLYQQLRFRPTDWSTSFVCIGLLGLGLLLPLAASGLVLYETGVLGRFWFWTIQYAFEYGRQPTLAAGWENFCGTFGRLGYAAMPLWILGGLGLLSLLSNKALRMAAPLILGWLGASFLSASAGLYFREHYFLLLLPGVGLLVAAAVHSFAQILQSTNSARGPIQAMAIFPAAAVFVLAVSYPVFAQASFFFFQSPVEACRATYQRNPFIESQVFGRYIMAHCAPEKTVAVLGSEPQVYFYSHRRSATGYIYTYGLMENQPYAKQMQHEMAAEIEAARPEYVVWVRSSFSWLARKESSKWILEWGAHYTQGMELVAIADILPEGTTYYWGAEAAGRKPMSPHFMALYRRKPGQ